MDNEVFYWLFMSSKLFDYIFPFSFVRSLQILKFMVKILDHYIGIINRNGEWPRKKSVTNSSVNIDGHPYMCSINCVCVCVF